jgi:hypothetical protein
MVTWGRGGIARRILNLGTRWRWVVIFTSRPPYHHETRSMCMYCSVIHWIVTPCSVVVGYHRFRGTCHRHLQSEVCSVRGFSSWSLFSKISLNPAPVVLGERKCFRISTLLLPLLFLCLKRSEWLTSFIRSARLTSGVNQQLGLCYSTLLLHWNSKCYFQFVFGQIISDAYN